MNRAQEVEMTKRMRWGFSALVILALGLARGVRRPQQEEKGAPPATGEVESR